VKTFGPFLLFVFLFSILMVGCAGISTETPATPSEKPPGADNNPASTTEFIYSSNRSSTDTVGGSISGFTVDRQTGSLTPIPGSPLQARAPGLIVSDPQGRHLFHFENLISGRGISCGDFEAVLVSDNIDPDSGALSHADSVTLNDGCPGGMVVDPPGKNLYVVTPSDLSNIRVFAIASAGTLQEIPRAVSLDNQSAETLAMRPDGKFVYATGGSGAGPGVMVLARDETTGGLALRQTVPTDMEFLEIAVSSDGAFVITTGTEYDFHSGLTHGEVSVFRASVSGELVLQSTLKYDHEPSGVEIDPSGKFAAITSFESVDILPGEITIYHLDPATGSLMPAGPPLAVGHMPSELRFADDGKFIYSIIGNDGLLAGFSFDKSSGSVTPLSQSPVKIEDLPAAFTIVRPQKGSN
jgi:6-phosphogluconolactonase (cycloisomerase 2 family)